MRCLSCVGQQWKTSPDTSNYKRRMQGTYRECADDDCPKRHHLQLWGMMHSLDLANLSELLGIEAPTRSKALSQTGEAADCYCPDSM